MYLRGDRSSIGYQLDDLCLFRCRCTYPWHAFWFLSHTFPMPSPGGGCFFSLQVSLQHDSTAALHLICMSRIPCTYVCSSSVQPQQPKTRKGTYTCLHTLITTTTVSTNVHACILWRFGKSTTHRMNFIIPFSSPSLVACPCRPMPMRRCT